MPDWSWWLILAVVFALGELAIFTGFIFGPLAVAAAVTAGAAALGAGIEVQLAVFIVLAVIMITALRPIAKRHMHSAPALTNTAALVGKRARVTESMTRDSTGMVRLENENWTAAPVEGVEEIAAETHVIVKRIDGATAVVEPETNTAEAEA